MAQAQGPPQHRFLPFQWLVKPYATECERLDEIGGISRWIVAPTKDKF